MNMTNFIIGLFTGALGIAYITYGRRTTRFAPLLSGVALCAYSYFFDSWIWLCIVGLLLLAVPFVFDF